MEKDGNRWLTKSSRLQYKRHFERREKSQS